MALEPDSFGLDFKDVDAASIDTLTIGIENIDQDCDVSDLVQSIYDDKIQLFPSKLSIAFMKLREVKNESYILFLSPEQTMTIASDHYFAETSHFYM